MHSCSMECPICLDPLKAQYGKTDCNHLYHVTCIGTWSKVSDKCPSCRKVLTSYNIIRHGKILKAIPWRAPTPVKVKSLETPLSCCLCESPTSARTGGATCGECSRHFHLRCVNSGPTNWECPLCEASNEAVVQPVTRKRTIAFGSVSPEVSRIQQRFDRLTDSDYTDIVNRQKASRPEPVHKEALDWQLFELAKRGTSVDLPGLVPPPERKLKKRVRAVGSSVDKKVDGEIADGETTVKDKKIVLMLEHKKVISKLLVRAFLKAQNLNDQQYTRVNANVCKRFYRYIEFHRLWQLFDWLDGLVCRQGESLDLIIRKVRDRAKDVEPITKETEKWRGEFNALINEWIKQEVDKK